MAGFLALSISDTYIGTYRATEELENGTFVEFDHKEKTATIAEAGATDVYFVVNENEDIVAEHEDTLDFRVKSGKFVRAHKPQSGEILVTTVIEDGLAEGDVVGVVEGGGVGTVTGEDAVGQFVVKELTGEFGVPTARLLVL